MRKRGKKLLAVLLAASMTLGQGTTWILAQEDVAEAIEGAAVSAQAEEDESESFGDESQDEPSGETGENPEEEGGSEGDGSSGDISGSGDGSSEEGDQEDGNDGNSSEDDEQGDGTQGDGTQADGDQQNGVSGENNNDSESIFGDGTDNESDTSANRVSIVKLIDDNGTILGKGILTGSDDVDEVSWNPEDDTNRGCDSSNANSIIRSFDDITYNVTSTINLQIGEKHTLVYEITLQDDDELSLDTDAMIKNREDASVSEPKKNKDGTKTYICSYTLQSNSSGGTKEEPIIVKVGNKSQGYKIKPTIRAYLDSDTANAVSVDPNTIEKVTVTSAPMYNIVLKQRSTEALRAQYIFTGEYENNASAYKDHTVVGYECTFGLALEMTKPQAGIKGVELPSASEPFTFDIDISNATINGESLSAHGFQPLLYNCEENKPDSTAVGEIPYTEPYLNSVTKKQMGCNNSGKYEITQDPDNKNILHVSVSGFVIDRTKFPQVNLTNKSYWEDINKIREGIFSAFRFQVVYPYYDKDGQSIQDVIGSGTVNIVAVVKNMSAVSEHGNRTTVEVSQEDNEQTASWELTSGGKRNHQIWYSVQNTGDKQNKPWTDEYTPMKKGNDGDVAPAGANDLAFMVNYSDQNTGIDDIENVPVAIDQFALFDSSALENVQFTRASGDQGYSCYVLYAKYKHGTHLDNETMRNVTKDDFEFSTTPDDQCDGVLFQYRGIFNKSKSEINLYAQCFADVRPKVKTDAVYMLTLFTDSWTVGDLKADILADINLENSALLDSDTINKWVKSKMQNKDAFAASTMVSGRTHSFRTIDGRDKYTVPNYTEGQYDVDENHNFSLSYADGLYIVPYITKVTIKVAQTGSDGKPRITYELSNKQRYADYVINSTIEYLNNEIVPKNDETTTVYLTATLPKGLSYKEESAVWGGTYSSNFPNAGTVTGGIDCKPKVTPNTNGTTTLEWKIEGVKLVNGQLPELHYTCVIGDEVNPDNDVKDGAKLNTEVTIQTTEDKRDPHSECHNISNATIGVARAKEFYIVKSGGAHLELNDESYYEMVAANTSSQDYNDLCIFDTMPFSGSYTIYKTVGEKENEKTTSVSKTAQKNGRYEITSLTMDAKAVRNAEDMEIWYTNDSKYTGKTAKDITENSSLSAITAENGWKKAERTKDEDGSTYNFSGDGLIGGWPTVIAYKDAKIEQNTYAKLRLTYSAEAGAENDQFVNTWSTMLNDKEVSSKVETDVYNRTLEGTVWFDGVEPDQDGKIGQDKDGKDEKKLKDVKVTLLRKNDEGNFVPYDAYTETVTDEKGNTVTDENGNPVEKKCNSTLYTDENGHYKFTGLPKGEYRVQFESYDGISLGGYDVTNYNEGGNDSCEVNSKVEQGNVEKSEDDLLSSAQIRDIKMPTIEDMIAKKMVSEENKTYNLPYQNLGLVTPTVNIEVSKWWDDNDNSDGVRPGSVTISLHQDGKKEAIDTLILNKDSQWRGKFANMPKVVVDEDGNIKKIHYSIQEEITDKDNPYESDIIVDSENEYKYTVKNSYTPQTISISGTKSWIDGDNADEHRPDSITVNLIKTNGNKLETVASKEVTSADNWSWNFDDLPKYENGKEIVYKIKEESVSDYITEYNGYNITNSYACTISGEKTWDDANNQDGKRPKYIIVHLMNGNTEVASETVTELKNWKWKFTVPKYDVAGNEISYSIKEESVDGYTPTVDGYNIKNSHIPEVTSVKVEKIWNDNNNQDGIRPTEIEIILYKNGTEIQKETVKADNNWKCEFTNLPKYEAGEEIAYTVSEVAVPNYTTEITFDKLTNTYNITNTYKPKKISVIVAKDWDDANNQDGKRPEKIIVHLLANGTDTGRSLELTEEKNWIGSFDDLDECQSEGQKIAYTIKEDSVENYIQGEITGNISNGGYRIKNTHKPETVKISGSKTWVDNENQDGIRPEKIKIHLLEGVKDSTSDNVENLKWIEIANQTVTKDDNWSWDFGNLPKYENGKEIPYKVTEDTVKGYTSEENGYNVTNTHTPETIEIPVTKVWNDSNNADKIRPNKVFINLLADEKSTDKKLELSEENNWTGKFENLPKYKDGTEIKYTVTEDTVNGYKSELTGDMENGYTVTNTHTPTPPYNPDPKPSVTPSVTPSITPMPSTTPTPSGTPTPSATPTPSETPKPSEAPKPSVTPPAEETPTPAPAAGSITVTKNLKVNGTPVGAENQKFYVALFEDEDCTQRASDVKTLAFQYASSATVTFDNLEPGKTYYVSETDENGEAILAGILDSGDIYTADFTNGNVVSVDSKNGSTVDFDNEFEDIPDGFYYAGNLKVTKTLLGSDGKAKNSDKTFYAGVFADADHTKLSGQVAKNIIPLSLNGASSVSDEVEVYMENADSVVKLYVTEVDKSGTPVEKDSSFAYSVTVKDGNATISKDALDARVVITNQEKNNPTPQGGGDTPSTQGGGSNPQSYSSGSSSVTPVKTGDSTPVMAMLLLLAASALVISTVMAKKKKSK